MTFRGKEIGGRLVITDSRQQTKYRAMPTTALGQKFASRKEAEYCQGLNYLQRAGEIRDLKFQVSFELYVNDIKICTYIADATYTDNSDGSFHVVDVKGFRTKEFRLKKKLMLACHGITIEEV